MSANQSSPAIKSCGSVTRLIFSPARPAQSSNSASARTGARRTRRCKERHCPRATPGHTSFSARCRGVADITSARRGRTLPQPMASRTKAPPNDHPTQTVRAPNADDGNGQGAPGSRSQRPNSSQPMQRIRSEGIPCCSNPATTADHMSHLKDQPETRTTHSTAAAAWFSPRSDTHAFVRCQSVICAFGTKLVIMRTNYSSSPSGSYRVFFILAQPDRHRHC